MSGVVATAISRSSDCAFALAALHAVDVLAVPVDEVDEVLDVELDGQREVLRGLLERLRPNAVDVGVERLALLALLFIEADPPLHRVGHALGREAHPQALAVLDLAAVVAAAHVGDVGRDLLLADLDRRAVEPDRPEVVLAAAVRAAGHLDVDAAAEWIVDLHLLKPLRDRPTQAHRARDPELAAVRAGAAHDVSHLVGSGLAQPELDEPPPHVVHRLVAHPAKDHVLLDARSRVPAGELTHDLRDAAELVGREVPARHLHLDRREALLALGPDVGGDEAIELGAVAVGRAGVDRRRRRLGLLVVDEQQRVRSEVALRDPVALHLLIHHLAEGVDADLVDQELDPRAHAVRAELLLAVEDPQDRLRDLQVVAVVHLHEVVERAADARHDRRAAAGADLYALHAVADARQEA